jgi:DNA-directed RNA polymerase specialized sigma24 family protein
LSHGSAKKEITAESFVAFLRWLNPDPAAAGEVYERLRFRLITYFAGRNCLHPEELADETINRVCLKIDSEVVENKVAYVYGFARNVFREDIRRRREQVSVDEIDLAAPETAADDDDGSHSCLDRCLGELPSESRGLILDYFSEAKRAKIDLHKSMAARFAMSQTALRMRIVRIKQRLRGCLEECLAG